MKAYLSGELSAQVVHNEVVDMISPDEDLGGNDDLLANSFIALSQIAEPEWGTTRREIEYLLACLEGRRQFSAEERDRVISS